MKYRCKIIGRLIFIEVLWKFFHFNTPIKVNSRFHLSSFIIISFCCHSYVYTFYGFIVSKQSNRAKSLSGYQNSPILLSGSQDSLTLLNLYLGLKVLHLYQILIVLEPFQMCTYIMSDYLG